MAVASADHRPTGPKENREYVLSVGNKYRKLFDPGHWVGVE